MADLRCNRRLVAIASLLFCLSAVPSAISRAAAASDDFFLDPDLRELTQFPPDENFDDTTPPALPGGWGEVHTGAGPGWITVVTNVGPGNSAFTDDTPTETDKSLESGQFFVQSNGRLTFRHKVNLELRNDGDAADGVALEIAIGAGPYQSIIEAGGEFIRGGYNHLEFCGPCALDGRLVWGGATAGFETVVVALPTQANGQFARLRWRMATDAQGSVPFAGGYTLDNVHLDLDVIFANDFECFGNFCN